MKLKLNLKLRRPIKDEVQDETEEVVIQNDEDEVVVVDEDSEVVVVSDADGEEVSRSSHLKLGDISTKRMYLIRVYGRQQFMPETRCISGEDLKYIWDQFNDYGILRYPADHYRIPKGFRWLKLPDNFFVQVQHDPTLNYKDYRTLFFRIKRHPLRFTIQRHMTQ